MTPQYADDRREFAGLRRHAIADTTSVAITPKTTHGCQRLVPPLERLTVSPRTRESETPPLPDESRNSICDRTVSTTTSRPTKTAAMTHLDAHIHSES